MNRRIQIHPFVRIVPFLLLTVFAAATGFSQTAVQEQLSVAPEAQKAIIDSVTAALNETYVFPDVAAKMGNLLRDDLNSGKYKTITKLSDFTDRVTADLQSVSHDKHLRLTVLAQRDQDQGTPVTPEQQRARMIERESKMNYRFKKVEILPGNIGYIDFRGFAETSIGDAAATAIAAMNFIAHTDAVIFDLRQNGGGSPSMIQLISSYLFEEPVHLNSFYIRKTDELQQFWTQGQVAGPKLVNVPVYVLTSRFTFSGAEEFSYNLKNLKRGTIVGEVTGGGAHPVDFVRYPALRVGLSLPFGRAINPITKTNWEGTGVEPDIKVPADEALTVARIEALKKIQEKEKDPAYKRGLEWALQILELEKTPVHLDETALKAFEGTYGPRKIQLENGSLTYQREGMPKSRLTPVGEDTFMMVGRDDFRIKFNRGTGGAVDELVLMYSDGNSDVSPRGVR